MDATTVAALLAQFDRELWLVTAQAGTRRGGLVATFVRRRVSGRGRSAEEQPLQHASRC
jgi:hypothetical protein